MRLQLFKGTYGVLLFLAIAGLFLMLRRQAGDGFVLTMWMGVIALGAGGLMATGNDLAAVSGTTLGFLSTLYLKFGGMEAAVVSHQTLDAEGPLRVDLTLGAYLILLIVLTIVWHSRRRRAPG